MSIVEKLDNNEGEVRDGCDAIEMIIESREKDLGGFSVRRVLPFTKRRMVGPWIFFDHMGPADFLPKEGVNVRPHPHINLATVTYLFEGEILHRDSLGNVQLILPGAINLMVAGKGITHSERERENVHNIPHRTHALQLWHALPEAYEECEPAFYHYPAEELPVTIIDGVPVRVMIGSAYGVTSPVKTYCNTLYIEASLSKGKSLILPNVPERGLYVVNGKIKVKESVLEQHHMAILKQQECMTITAVQDSRIALIGGEPIGERFIYWNFVSSRKERLEQAKQDWREGRFPKVSGDETEFIPLPLS